MLSFQKVIAVTSVALLATTALPTQAQIIIVNSAPELSLSLESSFGDNGVYPNEGKAGTEFTFRVRYRDIDGDEPEYVKVCLFLPGKNMGCHNLTVVTDDQDPQNAYEVEAQGAVQLTKPGDYSYYFKTYDGNGMWGPFPVRWPEQGEEFSLSVINSSNTSIAFIPGLQASRLYKEGFLGEDRLWEPTNRNEDVRDLMMNEAGLSIDPNIYTRDIIDETYSLNIYKGFMQFMDGLVNENTISNWEALPYDWRLAPNEIVERGVTQDNENISYFSSLPADTEPFMIAKLEELAQSSANGKVTIIAHSNGGLVAKALISKLTAMHEAGENDLITRIDRLIMVATPQMGTPKALAGLLHGDEQNLAKGFMVTKSVARELGENMPGAYTMLPSGNYFSAVADPIIEFAEDVKRIYDFRNLYGDNIDSLEELQLFLGGDNGQREEPADNDTDAPNVLNEDLLQQAQVAQDNLDNWQPPEGLEVIQVAGWGLDTIRGIQYDDCDFCLNPTLSNLDRKLISTYDGDETVVIPSAVEMEEPTYFVNLYKYNRKFVGGQVNRDHASLMEVSSLHELIEGLITSNSVILPSFITTTKPLVSKDAKKLRLTMHSPVSMGVYDSASNYTGLINNPNSTSDIQLLEEQIPNSAYFEFGETTYINLDMEDSYTVSLLGEAAGTFTLEIDEVHGDAVETTQTFYNVPVIPEMTGELIIGQDGNVSELSLDFNNDDIIDVIVSPSDQPQMTVMLNTLRQLIISMDLHKKVSKHLLKDLDKTVKELERGKIDKAGKKLDKMVKYLKKEARKYEKNAEKGRKKKDKHINPNDADMLISIIKETRNILVKYP